MKSDRSADRSPDAPSPGPARATPARTPRSPATAVLALQRSAGNRAAGRVLARYVKHPDKEKKGIMVPDVSAKEYDYFNPPKNE
jgi:hypothetical protein